MNTPTPETDAQQDDLIHADTYTCWQQTLVLARKLERERDDARKHSWNDMVCIHHTDRDRAACIGHCPVCLEAERDQLRKVCDELAQATRAEFGNLNWRLDAYNNLPHVKKLKVRF